MTPATTAGVDELAAWLRASSATVVLTGAGVSTASGIPDFRGPNGIWTRDPRAERLSNIGYYVADPAIRRESWRRRLENPAWGARPNDAHRALARLDAAGLVGLLVTQNIDGLHLAAGSDPTRVVEIHGSIRESACLTCGDRRPMRDTLARVRAGDPDPACEVCGGILKSATVSFGQNLDAALLRRAEDAAVSASCFLAVGTSLTVYPVARLPELAIDAGARVAIVNDDATALDDLAHLVLRGDAGELLSAVAAALDLP